MATPPNKIIKEMIQATNDLQPVISLNTMIPQSPETTKQV
jgi:hypothetical protein